MIARMDRQPDKHIGCFLIDELRTEADLRDQIGGYNPDIVLLAVEVEEFRKQWRVRYTYTKR